MAQVGHTAWGAGLSEGLDQGARTLRLGPLVQLALALAGETETQRWTVTRLGPWQGLDRPSLTFLFWPLFHGRVGGWQDAVRQTCLGSADPVHLRWDQSGGGQTPRPSTDEHPAQGPSPDCCLLCGQFGQCL